MKNREAEKIIKSIEDGYDAMSEKFSQTRKFFWRGLEFIAEYVNEGDRVLDYGCGNGRILEILGNKRIDFVGIDISQKLVDAAQRKYGRQGIVFRKLSNQRSLPFSDGFFNSVVSIAVFHHVPSGEIRRRLAQELFRVTAPGGMVVITVWNIWQRKYRKYIISNIFKKILGLSRMDFFDAMIPFRDNDGNTFLRYHHAFRLDDLASLFLGAGFEVERCEVVDGRNLVLVGRKSAK